MTKLNFKGKEIMFKTITVKNLLIANRNSQVNNYARTINNDAFIKHVRNKNKSGKMRAMNLNLLVEKAYACVTEVGHIVRLTVRCSNDLIRCSIDISHDDYDKYVSEIDSHLHAQALVGYFAQH
jgi:hypothetical protein